MISRGLENLDLESSDRGFFDMFRPFAKFHLSTCKAQEFSNDRKAVDDASEFSVFQIFLFLFLVTFLILFFILLPSSMVENSQKCRKEEME